MSDIQGVDISGLQGTRQFGRYVEIEIRDFKSKTKKIIGNDFEIDFEYFKSIDQVQEDDSGKIRIYGLTPDTIKSLQEGGGEVLLKCKYRESNLETLFHAYIARIYAEVSNNTTMTTIECSANLMNYYQSGTVQGSPNASPTSFLQFLLSVGKALGATETIIQPLHQQGLSEKFHKDFGEYVNTAEFKASFVGTHQQLLEDIKNNLGIGYIKKPLDSGGFSISFIFNDSAIEQITKIIDSGYRKVPVSSNLPAITPESQQVQNDRFEALKKMQTAESDDYEVVVLNEKTGLISVKIEYKIATAYADRVLYDSDVETLKSQQDGIDANVLVEKNRLKELEKERKAKEKGKTYIPKKSKFRTEIKVNRKYAKVKALLNPNVKPQSLVAVAEGVSLIIKDKDLSGNKVVDAEGQELEKREYLKMRVKDVRFKGNNKKGDWIMEAYCLDTDSKEQITAVDFSQLKRTTSPEDLTEEAEESEGIE